MKLWNILLANHQFQENIRHIYEKNKSSLDQLCKKLLPLHHHDVYQCQHKEHAEVMEKKIKLKLIMQQW